jgi:hypothetical protein
VATPEEQEAEARKAAEKKEEENRQKIVKDTSKWVYIFRFIPFRRLTPKEQIEQILLAEAEKDYLKRGDIKSLDKLRNNIAAAQPAAPEDPLDRVRIITTLIMVAALFAIVAVIVFNRTPPSGVNQLVSLASGLAGIGLGWLFGAATTRGKK